jgi:hypothetical protein
LPDRALLDGVGRRIAGHRDRQGVPKMLVRLVVAARIILPIAIVSAMALAAEAGQRWR